MSLCRRDSWPRYRPNRRAGPTHVDTLREDSAARCEVEAFIRACFRHAYAAYVRVFPPLLIALRGDHGELMAALGICAAARGPLFLERYLDVPVEVALGARLGIEIRRDGIVEVGNLVVAQPGGARWLIIALTAFLHARGDEWVVFTVVPAVRNAFLQLGLHPVPQAPAGGDRLGPAAGEWGRYFEGRPMVMAGRVEEGYKIVHAAVLLERILPVLLPIWQAGHMIGRQSR